MRSVNVRYLPGLDHLRAAAALLIVFYHGLHLLSFNPRTGGNPALLWPRTANPLRALLYEGHTAVALFMVLSGFVLSLGALGQEVPWRAFLTNRVLRIYPLLVFMVLAGSAVHPGGYSLLGALQALGLQADFPGSLAVGHFSAMFWAVSVELQFYLLFPLLHRFIEREGPRWALGAIALLVIMRVAALAAALGNAQDISYWHLFGRLDQFLLGMLAARVYRRFERAEAPWSLLALLALAAAMAVVLGFNRLGGFPAPGVWKAAWPTVEGTAWAAVIVCYARASERVPGWLSEPLARIGTYSYSIYLLHFVAIHVAANVAHYELGDRPDLHSQQFVLTVVLPPLLLVSALSYHVIERPFLALRLRYGRPEPAEARAQGDRPSPTAD
jgi:peptidoglycan/LPS O-acetylase OafA/YrhL